MSSKGFFPFFLDLRDKRILFIGGGTIATRRAGVLSAFDSHLEVVAPAISEELSALVERGRVDWQQKAYTEEDLDGADIVLICTDNAALNHEIWQSCRQQHILVNNCSNHEECDFYFPGIVAKDELVIGVNAGGNAHKKAALLRRDIAKLMEEGDYA